MKMRRCCSWRDVNQQFQIEHILFSLFLLRGRSEIVCSLEEGKLLEPYLNGTMEMAPLVRAFCLGSASDVPGNPTASPW
jgi:hypothetical protein